MSSPLSILIAEGNPYLRDQWVILLDGYQGLRVVGTADNGQQVVGLCTQFRPQVVLMDTEIPVTNGNSLRHLAPCQAGFETIGRC